jgi:hypothetical protein
MAGMSEERFWRSNPRTIEPYFIAREKRIFEIDRLSHVMGAYVYNAVSAAMTGLGKHPKPYRDKPFLAEEEERLRIERMSEEEKLREVEKIFEQLDRNVR